MNKEPLRVAILGSTRGTSLQPILDSLNDSKHYLSLFGNNISIVSVLSNKSTAQILTRARMSPACNKAKVDCIGPLNGNSRDEYDARITSILENLPDGPPDIILCIGYMRILSSSFCTRWALRVFNIHPSLLPKHAGLQDLAVHQSVIDARDRESGCSVHYITEKVDEGLVVRQTRVSVDPDYDTAEMIKARVQATEPIVLAETLLAFQRKEIGPYAKIMGF